MPRVAKKEVWKKKRKMSYLEQREFQYYIFCEGEQTEPLYFEGFKKNIEKNPIYKDMVLIEIEPCAKETLRVLREAEQYVRKNKLKKGQVWCVYDKDDFPKSDFNAVVQRIDSLNKENPNVQYHAAWSNQCIEFWFTLHFSKYMADNHRTMYVDFLNNKFKKLNLGKYEKNMQNIYEILLNYGNPKLAIQYAKQGIKESVGKMPADITPGTKVYELVEELVKYLPAEIKERFE